LPSLNGGSQATDDPSYFFGFDEKVGTFRCIDVTSFQCSVHV